MAIITPVSLWKNLDQTLDVRPAVLKEVIDGEVKIQYLNFSGRETQAGRVLVYAAFGCNATSPSRDAVLILPDSGSGIDERLIKLFVNKGYSVCMVDYRGSGFGENEFTVYPGDINYANAALSGRYKNFVDETAEKTSWYEWGAVGLYARKFLAERTGCEDVAVVGIRDGGEIAWKIITAAKFSCAVCVSAAGWLAYKGYEKFGSEEPKLNEERYRFIAGVDSQAYAPYVKCPVLMLCPVQDMNFDYDRAYDTFSRINPAFAEDSAIVYSVNSNECINSDGTQNMFMFLDKFVKNRQVFIPRSSTVNIFADSEQNLSAEAKFDSRGKVVDCKLYYAENCLNSAIREWNVARLKSVDSIEQSYHFAIDVYENSTQVFVLCAATYSSGFTVWSKVLTRKISGLFRNSQPKCNVLYSGKNGIDCFSVADYSNYSIGGVFLTNESVSPHLITKDKGIKGLYSPCGLATFRTNSERYAPAEDSILKFDFISDAKGVAEITMLNVVNNEKYTARVTALGGVWQSVILECKNFKNGQGLPLPSFKLKLRLSVSCGVPYAINNVMWL